MLTLNIQSRRIPSVTENNPAVDTTPLQTAMNIIAPPGCNLFHGTKISVLESMLNSTNYQGMLRPAGHLIKDNININTGETALHGQIANENNENAISTCEKKDIAVPLYYALRPSNDPDEYPVLFGINIDPENKELVKSQNFKDIGAFTDHTVTGAIDASIISMIMVPRNDLDTVKEKINNTVMSNIYIATFEDFFNQAVGWSNISDSSYDKLYEIKNMELHYQRNAHFNLCDHM